MPSCGAWTDSPRAERVDPAAQRLVGGYGQVEALAEAVRVDPEQLSLRVEDRAARGAGQQRGGVLQAAGDAQAARAAEGPVDAGDGPERHPQPAPARVGQGEDGRPDGGCCGGPRQRGGLAGVGLDDGEVAVDVVPGHVPLGRAPVGEGDRRLAAAHVVRVGQHPPLAEHDARADAPPLPDAGYRGAGVLRQPRDAGLNLVEDRHHRPFLPVSSNLQVTTNYDDVNAAATIVFMAQSETASSPLAEALARVGDRWTLLVVEALLPGPRRFNELLDQIPGIAANILSERLKRLEREALLVARPYSERPPRAAYQLTAEGQELAGALRLLAYWGAGHADPAQAPRHPACGTPVEARWYCPTCDHLVDHEPNHAEVHFV